MLEWRPFCCTFEWLQLLLGAVIRIVYLECD